MTRIAGCDVINFEINLTFLIKLFFNWTKKSRQNLNIKKELLRWNKKPFPSFLKDFQLPKIVSDVRVPFQLSNKNDKNKNWWWANIIEDEQTLLTIKVTISHKRPEVNIQSLIEYYEFSFMPRSILSFDGEILSCKDKKSLIHLIVNVEEVTYRNQQRTKYTNKKN